MGELEDGNQGLARDDNELKNIAHRGRRIRCRARGRLSRLYARLPVQMCVYQGMCIYVCVRRITCQSTNGSLSGYVYICVCEKTNMSKHICTCAGI